MPDVSAKLSHITHMHTWRVLRAARRKITSVEFITVGTCIAGGLRCASYSVTDGSACATAAVYSGSTCSLVALPASRVVPGSYSSATHHLSNHYSFKQPQHTANNTVMVPCMLSYTRAHSSVPPALRSRRYNAAGLLCLTISPSEADPPADSLSTRFATRFPAGPRPTPSSSIVASSVPLCSCSAAVLCFVLEGSVPEAPYQQGR